MSVVYDLYQPGASWLHRLDPRTKLALALCGCALLVMWHNIWLIVALLALTQGVLLSAGISRRRIGWVWKLTAPTMGMIALMWTLFNRGTGPVLFQWWFIQVSLANLAEAAAMALRLGALAFCIFCWLFSTDQETLVRGLVALGLPFTWGLTLAIALRYLPTMANAFRMISDAQQARALDLTQGGPLKRARAYIPITIAMLISALRTAQNLAHALETRALGASPRRTALHPIQMAAVDWVLIALALLTSAALAAARLLLGVGAQPF